MSHGKINWWFAVFATILYSTLVSATVTQELGPQGVYQSTLKVLAFGDSGSCSSPSAPATCVQNRVARAMLQVCENDGCDMGIMLGDNIYEDGVSSSSDDQFRYKFDFHYDPLNLEIFAALGNHDVASDSIKTTQQIQAQVDYSNHSDSWRMYGEYYDYVRGNVHFIVINSNDFDREQQRWLRQTLKKDRAQWKVVYGHHPIRSSGQHGDTGELLVELLPLICSYADLYLAGHDHNLELLESDCDVPLVVSGAAGKIRRVDVEDRRPQSVWSKSTYGFSTIEFSSDRFIVRFFDDEGNHLFERSYSKILQRKAPSLYRGSLKILNSENNQCFHASGSKSVGNGWELYNRSCIEDPYTGSSSDRYYLKASTGSHPGAYKIINKKYSTCVHTSRKQKVGGHYDLYHQSCVGGSSAEYFNLVYMGDGFWTIQNDDYQSCIQSSDTVISRWGGHTFFDEYCGAETTALFSFEY